MSPITQMIGVALVVAFSVFYAWKLCRAGRDHRGGTP